MTKPETERERLLNRLFPPGEPEKHVQNIKFFRGTHPGAIDPEVFCAEVNKALDAVERGDCEVFDHFPDAASPPAPSVPDVVREWNSPRKGTNLIAVVAEMDELGDRMAAALTEAANDPSWGITFWRDKATTQAKTIEGLREEYALCRTLLMERTAEVERLTGDAVVLRAEVGKLFDMSAANFDRATTADSSLETARGALVETEKHLWWAWAPPWKQKEAPPYLKRVELLELVREALAALPSPPITKIKGEG